MEPNSTRYCTISGCSPEIMNAFDRVEINGDESEVLASAIQALSELDEADAQDDLCIIGPMDSRGEPYSEVFEINPGDSNRILELPGMAVRVVPHCFMGEWWCHGSASGHRLDFAEFHTSYHITGGYQLMVQTYALDIMALATHGRMTSLRLWRLAMRQGLGRPYMGPSSRWLQGVDYGEIVDLYDEFLEPFPGFLDKGFEELEYIEDVEVVMERLVHEGKFWVWMAPDRFPIDPKKEYISPAVTGVCLCENRSMIERLAPEMLGLIISYLPLRSLLDLASASRSLRLGILGNDHLARAWIYNKAPWWIPVSTQASTHEPSGPLVYLASEWSPRTSLVVDFPVGLDWAYVGRCMRSGSMRNRRRIWDVALDIERVADLTGV